MSRKYASPPVHVTKERRQFVSEWLACWRALTPAEQQAWHALTRAEKDALDLLPGPEMVVALKQLIAQSAGE